MANILMNRWISEFRGWSYGKTMEHFLMVDILGCLAEGLQVGELHHL